MCDIFIADLQAVVQIPYNNTDILELLYFGKCQEFPPKPSKIQKALKQMYTITWNSPARAYNESGKDTDMQNLHTPQPVNIKASQSYINHPLCVKIPED